MIEYSLHTLNSTYITILIVLKSATIPVYAYLIWQVFSQHRNLTKSLSSIRYAREDQQLDIQISGYDAFVSILDFVAVLTRSVKLLALVTLTQALLNLAINSATIY